jgi:ornithine carbamoyltransferase
MNYESGGLKDLVSTDCLSRADVETLLDTAAIYAKDPLRDSKFLANQTVVIYMNKA